MTDRVLAPIIIGITGKLELGGSEESVRLALRHAFRILDRLYPDTPKILLSALAAGADTIGAEEAIARPGWRLIAVLPLPREVYLEDFDEAAAARFSTLLDDPRVKSLTLAPLISAETGMPFTSTALKRSPDVSNFARTQHYEQVGLFVAQRSALLLAVMSAEEKPGRLGGTARIVNYRLRGTPDEDALAVIEQSQELRLPIPLDRPPTGPVWLIDLAALGNLPAGHEPGDPTVMLPTYGVLRERPERRWPIVASLGTLRRIDKFNRRVAALGNEQWRLGVEARSGPDAGDASSMLKRLRSAISVIQASNKAWVHTAIWTLALLFVVAISAVELRDLLRGTSWEWPVWPAYAVAGLTAICIYVVGEWNEWKSFAEEYRATAEALRVQMAWWDSGLVGPDHQVARFFLCGTTGRLGQLRAAVKYIVDAVELSRLSGAAVNGAALRWIDGQIDFFKSRIRARHLSLAIGNAFSWLFFMAALGVASFISYSSIRGHFFPNTNPDPQGNTAVIPGYILPPTLVSALLILIVLLALYILLPSSSFIRHLTRRVPALRLIGVVAPLLVGVLIALGLVGIPASAPKDPSSPANEAGIHRMASSGAEATQPSAPKEGTPTENAKSNPQPGVDLLAILAILPAAMAGALRFVMDKLSWEAELHRYVDALETFQRARTELATIDGLPLTSATRATRQANLLLALGKEALEESESWLREHQERPLEPVVGG